MLLSIVLVAAVAAESVRLVRLVDSSASPGFSLRRSEKPTSEHKCVECLNITLNNTCFMRYVQHVPYYTPCFRNRNEAVILIQGASTKEQCTMYVSSILNAASVLSEDWPIRAVQLSEIGLCSSKILVAVRSLARHIRSGRLRLENPPLDIARNRQDLLLSTTFWEWLAPAKKILLFDATTRLCSNSDYSIEDFMYVIGKLTEKYICLRVYNRCRSAVSLFIRSYLVTVILPGIMTMSVHRGRMLQLAAVACCRCEPGQR